MAVSFFTLLAITCVLTFLSERHKENTYKTSLCRKFRETGKCERGEACIFAHGEEELRRPPRVHPKYKTQLCNNFIKWNYCPYGSRCQFIHDHAGESMQFTNWRTTGDLESVHNNFSHMESFNMKQKDTSIRCMSSSVTPAELFAEQSGFCHSYANPVFNRAGNMGYFAECMFKIDFNNMDLVGNSVSLYALFEVSLSYFSRQKLENGISLHSFCELLATVNLFKTINNQSTTNIVCGNQSHSHARPFASNGILDQLNSIDSDSVLEQLSEQFNNMLI
uniref:C3H1-type domain-containing protein n=1 Tax=Elaeophora elaphi TaxID=1147741 RepID=A0A0R3RZG6_9BILA